MKKPQLQQHQFAVGHTELKTGHVLQPDFELYTGDGELFKVFDTLQEAKAYALDTVRFDRQIECWIQDAKGDHLITINKHGEHT